MSKPLTYQQLDNIPTGIASGINALKTAIKATCVPDGDEVVLPDHLFRTHTPDFNWEEDSASLYVTIGTVDINDRSRLLAVYLFAYRFNQWSEIAYIDAHDPAAIRIWRQGQEVLETTLHNGISFTPTAMGEITHREITQDEKWLMVRRQQDHVEETAYNAANEFSVVLAQLPLGTHQNYSHEDLILAYITYLYHREIAEVLDKLPPHVEELANKAINYFDDDEPEQEEGN